MSLFRPIQPLLFHHPRRRGVGLAFVPHEPIISTGLVLFCGHPTKKKKFIRLASLERLHLAERSNAIPQGHPAGVLAWSSPAAPALTPRPGVSFSSATAAAKCGAIVVGERDCEVHEGIEGYGAVAADAAL